MKARTRCRICRISGVIVMSGILLLLCGCQLPEPVKALLCLSFWVSLGRDDVEDGRRDPHLAVELDLCAAGFCAAENEDIIHNLFGHQPQRLLPISRLPGVHHRAKDLAATKPFVESVVERSGQVGRDDIPSDHLRDLPVLRGDYEDATGYVR